MQPWWPEETCFKNITKSKLLQMLTVKKWPDEKILVDIMLLTL